MPGITIVMGTIGPWTPELPHNDGLTTMQKGALGTYEEQDARQMKQRQEAQRTRILTSESNADFTARLKSYGTVRSPFKSW